MVTGHMGPMPLFAPAILRLVDSTKAGFVLKHQPHSALSLLGYFGSQKLNLGLNFFEALIASSSALFGCWLRGMTFRHPCRFST